MEIHDGKIPFLNEKTTLEQVTLDKVFLYCTGSMMSDYPTLRDNAKIQEIFSQSVKQIVFQMTSWCSSGRIPDMEVWEQVQWPDGVWQMFKSKFMPRWFVEKYPVLMAEKRIKTQTNHYFVCPHIGVPNDRPHIQFMMTGTRTAERIGGEERKY